jgi:hypothetical protein
VAAGEGGGKGGEKGGELAVAVRGLQQFGEEVKELLQVGGGSEVQVGLGVGVCVWGGRDAGSRERELIWAEKGWRKMRAFM